MTSTGTDDWLRTNRRHWDERVPMHVASDFYDLDGFRAGRDPLRSFEIEELGDIAGKSLVHLQCHFGLDTLAWVRRGASVVGVDFSEPAVEAARTVAAEIGIPAEFVTANVYNAPEACRGGVSTSSTRVSARSSGCPTSRRGHASSRVCSSPAAAST